MAHRLFTNPNNNNNSNNNNHMMYGSLSPPIDTNQVRRHSFEGVGSGVGGSSNSIGTSSLLNNNIHSSEALVSNNHPTGSILGSSSSSSSAITTNNTSTHSSNNNTPLLLSSSLPLQPYTTSRLMQQQQTSSPHQRTASAFPASPLHRGTSESKINPESHGAPSYMINGGMNSPSSNHVFGGTSSSNNNSPRVQTPSSLTSSRHHSVHVSGSGGGGGMSSGGANNFIHDLSPSLLIHSTTTTTSSSSSSTSNNNSNTHNNIQHSSDTSSNNDMNLMFMMMDQSVINQSSNIRTSLKYDRNNSSSNNSSDKNAPKSVLIQNIVHDLIEELTSIIKKDLNAHHTGHTSSSSGIGGISGISGGHSSHTSHHNSGQYLSSHGSMDFTSSMMMHGMSGSGAGGAVGGAVGGMSSGMSGGMSGGASTGMTMNTNSMTTTTSTTTSHNQNININNNVTTPMNNTNNTNNNIATTNNILLPSNIMMIGGTGGLLMNSGMNTSTLNTSQNSSNSSGLLMGNHLNHHSFSSGMGSSLAASLSTSTLNSSTSNNILYSSLNFQYEYPFMTPLANHHDDTTNKYTNIYFNNSHSLKLLFKYHNENIISKVFIYKEILKRMQDNEDNITILLYCLYLLKTILTTFKRDDRLVDQYKSIYYYCKDVLVKKHRNAHLQSQISFTIKYLYRYLIKILQKNQLYILNMLNYDKRISGLTSRVFEYYLYKNRLLNNEILKLYQQHEDFMKQKQSSSVMDFVYFGSQFRKFTKFEDKQAELDLSHRVLNVENMDTIRHQIASIEHEIRNQGHREEHDTSIIDELLLPNISQYIDQYYEYKDNNDQYIESIIDNYDQFNTILNQIVNGCSSNLIADENKLNDACLLFVMMVSHAVYGGSAQNGHVTSIPSHYHSYHHNKLTMKQLNSFFLEMMDNHSLTSVYYVFKLLFNIYYYNLSLYEMYQNIPSIEVVLSDLFSKFCDMAMVFYTSHHDKLNSTKSMSSSTMNSSTKSMSSSTMNSSTKSMSSSTMNSIHPSQRDEQLLEQIKASICEMLSFFLYHHFMIYNTNHNPLLSTNTHGINVLVIELNPQILIDDLDIRVVYDLILYSLNGEMSVNSTNSTTTTKTKTTTTSASASTTTNTNSTNTNSTTENTTTSSSTTTTQQHVGEHYDLLIALLCFQLNQQPQLLQKLPSKIDSIIDLYSSYNYLLNMNSKYNLFLIIFDYIIQKELPSIDPFQRDLLFLIFDKSNLPIYGHYLFKFMPNVDKNFTFVKLFTKFFYSNFVMKSENTLIPLGNNFDMESMMKFIIGLQRLSCHYLNCEFKPYISQLLTIHSNLTSPRSGVSVTSSSAAISSSTTSSSTSSTSTTSTTSSTTSSTTTSTTTSLNLFDHLLKDLIFDIHDESNRRQGELALFNIMKFTEDYDSLTSSSTLNYSSYLGSTTTTSGGGVLNQTTNSSSSTTINHYYSELRQQMNQLLNEMIHHDYAPIRMIYLNLLEKKIQLLKSKCTTHGDSEKVKLMIKTLNESLLECIVNRKETDTRILMRAFHLVFDFISVCTFPHSYHQMYSNSGGGIGSNNNNNTNSTNNGTTTTTTTINSNNHNTSTGNHRTTTSHSSSFHSNNSSNANHSTNGIAGHSSYPLYHQVFNMDIYDLFLNGHVSIPFYLLKDISISILYYLFESLHASTPQTRQLSSISSILLILIIEKCNKSPHVLASIGGITFFKNLLQQERYNATILYYTSKYLMKQLSQSFPKEYYKYLSNLILKAQTENLPNLLQNPYNPFFI